MLTNSLWYLQTVDICKENLALIGLTPLLEMLSLLCHSVTYFATRVCMFLPKILAFQIAAKILANLGSISWSGNVNEKSFTEFSSNIFVVLIKKHCSHFYEEMLKPSLFCRNLHRPTGSVNISAE